MSEPVLKETNCTICRKSYPAEVLEEPCPRCGAGFSSQIFDEELKEAGLNYLAPLQNILKIGENDFGYWFGVGQMFGNWYGFAAGKDQDGETLFFLPGCDELNDFQDQENSGKEAIRREIIRRAGAVAQSAEHGYGGVSRWFVEEDLRGKPADFMCKECGSVGCSPPNHY